MPQTITKQDVFFDEIRIRRVITIDNNGNEVIEYHASTTYKVSTDDPLYTIRKDIESGALAGQLRTRVDTLFTNVYDLVKAKEDIP